MYYLTWNLKFLNYGYIEHLSKLKPVAMISSLILHYFINLFHMLCVYHIHSFFYTFLYTFSLGIKSLSPSPPFFFSGKIIILKINVCTVLVMTL